MPKAWLYKISRVLIPKIKPHFNHFYSVSGYKIFGRKANFARVGTSILVLFNFNSLFHKLFCLMYYWLTLRLLRRAFGNVWLNHYYNQLEQKHYHKLTHKSQWRLYQSKKFRRKRFRTFASNFFRPQTKGGGKREIQSIWQAIIFAKIFFVFNWFLSPHPKIKN